MTSDTHEASCRIMLREGAPVQPQHMDCSTVPTLQTASKPSSAQFHNTKLSASRPSADPQDGLEPAAKRQKVELICGSSEQLSGNIMSKDAFPVPTSLTMASPTCEESQMHTSSSGNKWHSPPLPFRPSRGHRSKNTGRHVNINRTEREQVQAKPYVLEVSATAPQLHSMGKFRWLHTRD